jgi:hypothetical protein
MVVGSIPAGPLRYRVDLLKNAYQPFFYVFTCEYYGSACSTFLYVSIVSR